MFCINMGAHCWLHQLHQSSCLTLPSYDRCRSFETAWLGKKVVHLCDFCDFLWSMWKLLNKVQSSSCDFFDTVNNKLEINTSQSVFHTIHTWANDKDTSYEHMICYDVKRLRVVVSNQVVVSSMSYFHHCLGRWSLLWTIFRISQKVKGKLHG